MPYELYNEHSCNLELNFGRGIGSVMVKPHTAFPTPEQEALGILAVDIRKTEFFGPSFLSNTPPKLLERFRAGKAAVVQASGQKAAPEASRTVEEITKEGFRPMNATSIEKDLQELIDRKCSSAGKHKNPVTPPK
jgi:hypothetical protein